MSTHQITASIGTIVTTYRLPDTLSQKSYSYFNNVEVTVIDEYNGRNCNFSKISSSQGESYIQNTFLLKLPETPESSPFVCNMDIPNLRYVEPTWYTIPDNKPYFNEKTLEYSVVVTTNYLDFSNVEGLNNQIIDKGIRQLLSYYNKQNDEETITKLKNYFIFSKVKETYVPYRRFSRIKGLLTVHKKYFDAVPISTTSQQEIPFGISSDQANYILRIGFDELETLFNSLINTLKIYNTDVYVSNTKLGFTLTDYKPSPLDTSKEIMEELSLSNKADDVSLFYTELKDLFSTNGVEYQSKNENINKSFVEFAINDKCNKIYDVSINKNNNCIRLRIGIETFLRTSPIDDPTTVALIKNIKRIARIERCKVPWPEFVETYIYPKVIVRNVSLNDVLQNFEKNKFQYAKDLIQIYNSIQQEGQYYPALTYEQTVEQELKIAKFKSEEIWSLFKGNILSKNLYVGDNFVSRPSLDKFFNNLTKAIESTPDTYSVYSDQINIMLYSDENLITKYGAVQQKDGYYLIDNNNKTTYQLSEIQVKFPSDPKRVLKIVDNSGTTDIQATLYKLKPITVGVKTVQDQLSKLYDTLNIFGICKMIDYSLGCVLSLAKDFVDIDIQATIATGVISDFSYDQMTKDVIPYLPKEQQELVYKEFIERTACLNFKNLLFILKSILPTSEYENYGFDSYQNSQIPEEQILKNVIEAISKLMSTSPQ
jgi:hypothetical protein